MLDSIPSFARLVTELAKFPGVGRKTATRLAFYLLRQPEQQAEALAAAIREVKTRVRLCSRCFHLTEADQAKEWLAKGMRLFTYQNDIRMLMDAGKANTAQLREFIGKKG